MQRRVATSMNLVIFCMVQGDIDFLFWGHAFSFDCILFGLILHPVARFIQVIPIGYISPGFLSIGPFMGQWDADKI